MSSDGVFLDYLLGEGDRAEREAIRRRIAEQPKAALEVAELGLMLDRFRSDAEKIAPASPGLSLGLRHAIRRRAMLRGVRVQSVAAQFVRVMQIAAGLTLLLYIVQESQSTQLAELQPVRGFAVVSRAVSPEVEPPRVDRELSALLAVEYSPVVDASFLRSLERYSARVLPEDSSSWLQADNLLRRLREEQRLRSSPFERRRILAASGSPDLGDRVDSLAATIAWRARTGLAETDVVATSLVLRALLVAGSTLMEGPHRDVVRSSAQRLVNQVDDLEGAPLARSLAALSELAVASGAPFDAIVATHGDRLARSILRSSTSDGQRADRPALLSWRSPAASLADAGQFLKLAPAFGVHSGLAFRARLMVAAHLGERLELSEREQPNLRAAQLYGFGDLVDRSEIDRELRLWRPRMLLPDYDALYHLAYSKYPARSGWARFQQELRGLAAAATPAEIGDAAALLLCLSSNFAAPGSLGMMQVLAAR